MDDKKAEVSVYIEGLLVQIRDAEEVYEWATKNMKEEVEHIADEISTSYNAWDKKRPWAHHFNSMDGYIIIKKSIMYDDPKRSDVSVVNVTLNAANKDAPTLSVVSEMYIDQMIGKYVVTMAALAKYYMADAILLGDSSETD